MPSYLYISLAVEEKIAVYQLDPQSGRLALQEDVALKGGPSPLAVDPGQRFMYAGLRSSCQMASLRIDPKTGGLRPMSTIPLESDPCYVSTDRTGRFLLSAYYGAGRVGVHPIGPDGVARIPPVAWLATAPKAHCIQTDPSNRYAFVPHVMDANVIMQFRFDSAIGALAPNSAPRALSPGPVGPRHYCYHPTLPVLYFTNEQGSSVTAYRLNASAGTLTPYQTLSTLPAGYGGQNTCAQIHLHPSNRFLYASNRGHDSIACFAVDPESGWLTASGRQPTEPVPRAFGVDPGGRYLFAAGLDSGRLASYRIDPLSGGLTPLAVYPVGGRPMWVLALHFP